MPLTLESTEGSHSTKRSDNKCFSIANCVIQIHILVFRVILFSLSDSCFGVVKDGNC